MFRDDPQNLEIHLFQKNFIYEKNNDLFNLNLLPAKAKKMMIYAYFFY